MSWSRSGDDDPPQRRRDRGVSRAGAANRGRGSHAIGVLLTGMALLITMVLVLSLFPLR
jgi:hypothetical protein